MTVSAFVRWTCNLCHDSENSSKLPRGWRTVDKDRFHICPNCRGELERMKIIAVDPWATTITPYQQDGASPAKAGA